MNMGSFTHGVRPNLGLNVGGFELLALSAINMPNGCVIFGGPPPKIMVVLVTLEQNTPKRLPSNEDTLK